MPLKTFEGVTVLEVFARAQAELGPDAVIVETKHQPGGVLIRVADPVTASAEIAVSAAQTRAQTLANERAAHTANPHGEPIVGALLRPAVTKAASAPAAERVVLAFVGPTGAGKTTAVAKLATHPKIFAGRRVGLLNVDTYRVGAAEQIGAYAALARIPMASVHDVHDVPRAMRALRRCEVILVDCPGRGPRLKGDLASVRAVLDAVKPVERHLVMPVGMQPSLIRRLIAHYAPLDITHLLASKVDEMPDDWILFDQASDLGLPMRWLTDGQTVPHDIRSATARMEAVRAGQAGRKRRAEAVA